MTLQRDVGALVKVLKGTPPADASAGTVNGAAIDRNAYGRALSAVLHHCCGAASGTPSTQTVDTKLQDSADGSTGWADIADAAAAQLTADSTEAEVSVNLETAKRYIRVVQVVAFTGGTTPAIEVASTVVLGGPDKKPN